MKDEENYNAVKIVFRVSSKSDISFWWWAHAEIGELDARLTLDVQTEKKTYTAHLSVQNTFTKINEQSKTVNDLSMRKTIAVAHKWVCEARARALKRSVRHVTFTLMEGLCLI